MEKFEKIRTIMFSVGTFIIFIVDFITKINDVSQSLWGKIILSFALAATLGALIYSVYIQLRNKFNNSSEKLTAITKEVERFVEGLKNARDEDLQRMVKINPEIIDLNAATRKIAKLDLKVTEIHPDATTKNIELHVNKGFADNIRDDVQFRISHVPSATQLGMYPVQRLKQGSFAIVIPPDIDVEMKTGIAPGRWKPEDIKIMPETTGNLTKIEAIFVQILNEA